MSAKVNTHMRPTVKRAVLVFSLLATSCAPMATVSKNPTATAAPVAPVIPTYKVYLGSDNFTDVSTRSILLKAKNSSLVEIKHYFTKNIKTGWSIDVYEYSTDGYPTIVDAQSLDVKVNGKIYNLETEDKRVKYSISRYPYTTINGPDEIVDYIMRASYPVSSDVIKEMGNISSISMRLSTKRRTYDYSFDDLQIGFLNKFLSEEP
jgi:hypothetical protein